MSTMLADRSANPAFGKGFVGNPQEWANELKTLSEAVTMMVAEEEVMVDGRVFKAPSFGPYGLKMPTTPIFVFDRPELIPVFGHTMLTDSAHVFIYLPFLRFLVNEFNEEGTYGLPLCLAHELGHMMMNHKDRHLALPADKYSHSDVNCAMDAELNIPLYDDFNETYPVGTFFSTALWGVQPDQRDRWRHLAFEEMIDEIPQEKEKLKKEQQQKQQAAQDKKGEPSPEQGNDSADGESQPGESQPGEGQPGEGDPELSPSNGDTLDKHITDMEEMVEQITKIAQETGDDSLLEALAKAGIIKKKDIDAIKQSVESGQGLPSRLAGELQQIEDAAKSSSRQAIQQAQDLHEKMGGSMPGSHSVDYMVSRIRADEEPNITWQSVLRKKVQGIGAQRQNDNNKANSLSYLRAQDLGIKKRMPYLPGKTMAKTTVRIRAAVDTSGSMSAERDLVEAAAELIGLANQLNAELYVYSIDTTIRDYPALLTADDLERIVDQGINFFGRGGTDIARGLIEMHNRNESDDIANALNISSQNRQKARSALSGLNSRGFGKMKIGKHKDEEHFDITVYISDLEDFVPPPDTLTPAQIENVLLLATSRVPQATIRNFSDGGWATYSTSKDTMIDIDNLQAAM